MKKTALILAFIILISVFCAVNAYAEGEITSGNTDEISSQEPYSSPDAEDPANTIVLVMIAAAAVIAIAAVAFVASRRINFNK